MMDVFQAAQYVREYVKEQADNGHGYRSGYYGTDGKSILKFESKYELLRQVPPEVGFAFQVRVSDNGSISVDPIG